MRAWFLRTRHIDPTGAATASAPKRERWCGVLRSVGLGPLTQARRAARKAYINNGGPPCQCDGACLPRRGCGTLWAAPFGAPSAIAGHHRSGCRNIRPARWRSGLGLRRESVLVALPASRPNGPPILSHSPMAFGQICRKCVTLRGWCRLRTSFSAQRCDGAVAVSAAGPRSMRDSGIRPAIIARTTHNPLYAAYGFWYSPPLYYSCVIAR